MKRKMTSRRLLCVIITLAAIACTGLESPRTPPKIPHKPVEGEEEVKEEIQTREVLSYCGVKYPSGYDWRSDPQYGNVTCKVFLNVDGEDIIEMDAGYGHEISPDPDSHHIVNENLYTDFSNKIETVVRKNGSELFRYPGREMLLGLVVKDDVVYTLGQSRSGNGFSFRADGKVLLDRMDGNVFTGLLEYNGSLYFGYEENSEYFIYNEGGCAKLESMGHKLCDMRISKGEIILLGGDGSESPVIIRNGVVEALGTSGARSCIDCRFLQDGDILLVTGYLDLKQKNGKYLKCATMWTLPGTEPYTLTSEWEGVSYFLKDGKFCYIAGRWNRFPYMMARWENQTFVSKSLYIYPNSGSGIIHNGELYAGISKRETGEACILTESGVKELGFNGCVTRFALSSRVINSSER